MWASSRAQNVSLPTSMRYSGGWAMIDVALADQFRHVPEEERQHQRGDVMAVRVGVHEQDDLAITQTVDVELVAGAGADGRYQIV